MKQLKIIYHRIKHLKYFCSILKLLQYFSCSYKIRGINNSINNKGALLKNVTFDIEGDNNEIVLSKSVYMNSVTFFIRGNNHKILIQDNCRFYRGSNIWFEDNNCTLLIKKNTTIQDVHIAVTEPDSTVTIGEDCTIAYDIDIRTGDSHSIIDINSGKRINYAADVNIGNHVWIAAHVIILKGCAIGNHCVIATGSIVTKSFNEDNVIIAGNPAKIVKKDITWDRRRL